MDDDTAQAIQTLYDPVHVLVNDEWLQQGWIQRRRMDPPVVDPKHNHHNHIATIVTILELPTHKKKRF
jgi:hypothetical protein